MPICLQTLIENRMVNTRVMALLQQRAVAAITEARDGGSLRRGTARCRDSVAQPPETPHSDSAPMHQRRNQRPCLARLAPRTPPERHHLPPPHRHHPHPPLHPLHLQPLTTTAVGNKSGKLVKSAIRAIRALRVLHSPQKH